MIVLVNKMKIYEIKSTKSINLMISYRGDRHMIQTLHRIVDKGRYFIPFLNSCKP